MVAPARDPRRAPRRTGPAERSGARPDLRVVGRKPVRRRRTGVRLAAGCCALFLALFTNAVAHSMLVSGQEHLDGLNTRVEQEQARNERLQLRAAQLEAPARITSAATRLGLVPSKDTTWLNGNDDAGSVPPSTHTPSGNDAGTEELAGPKSTGNDTAGQ